MRTFSVEVVQVELWPIAWKQCTGIWNLQTSLFQLLSNILVYKNHHVYIFFCKVLSVIFKASSTILSMSKGPLIIRIVHGRTSYEVFFRPPQPPPPPARLFKNIVISRSVSWHANWLLCLLLARFDHCATGKCNTRKSINLIHNHWLFAIYVLFVFCLLHFKPSLNKHTLFLLICGFLLLKILNYKAVVSCWTHINNRFC